MHTFSFDTIMIIVNIVNINNMHGEKLKIHKMLVHNW